MALTKNDLAQIKTVVKTEVSESEKRLTQNIEDEVGESAAMTKRGFDAQDEHFEKHDKQFEAIIKKLLEHDEQFVEIEQKLDSRFDNVLTAIDKVLVIVQRLDQERVFTFAAIKRIQEQVDKNQKEIIQIKKVLNIA